MLGLLDMKKHVFARIPVSCFVNSVIDFNVLHSGRWTITASELACRELCRRTGTMEAVLETGSYHR